MFRIQCNAGALGLAAAMSALSPATAMGDGPADATPGPFANETDRAPAKPVAINSALLTVTVPADSVLVLKPDTRLKDGYTPCKRIQ